MIERKGTPIENILYNFEVSYFNLLKSKKLIEDNIHS